MSDYDDGPPIGRIPPHNDEAERGVLGALLIDPHRIPDVTELLHAADFFSKKHGLIFEALVGLSDRGEPVDMITVGERLLGAGSLQQVGGRSYLLQLASSVTNSAHVLHHARLVSETSTLRRLIQQANGIIEQAYSTRPDGDAVSSLVDESENAIFKISESKSSGEVLTIASAIEETFKRIDSTAGRSGGLTGVPSGFYDLDDLTCGFTGGQLIILAARPAMGKTALALNLMENAAFSQLPEVDGPPVVLFFSLEMGAQQIVSRMLCAHARVDAHKLKTGNIPADDYSELARAAGELRECRMFIDDTPGLSVMAMRSRARRVKQQNKALNLIVVDYLQLMTMPKSESRQLEISAISRSLKELARELDVPVIALSQLSRAVESREDKKPQLSDLRESGSIEQDADTVMLLYRPEYYEPTDENRGIAELVVAKQRNGPTGTVSLQFRGSIMRFENRAPSVAEPIAPLTTPQPPVTFAHLLNAVARALICAAVLLPPARAQDGGQEQRMPTVVGIEVTGEDRYAEDRLIAALGQRVGRPLDRELVERGITYLWEAFKVRAEVLERAAEGGIELQLIVQEMPVDLEPRFIGYDGVKLKDLREWAGLDESSELYLHQARRVRQRLLEGYRRKGFHFVEIDIVTKTPDEFDEDTHGIGDVIFRIREGRKVRVSDVVVHGNESLPTRGFGPWKDGLVPVARTQLKGPRFLNWLGDVFVEEKLEGDLLAMRNVYRDRGYLDAVVELDRLEFNEDFSRVVIHVVVDEGDPYTVSSLHIVGVKQLPDTRGLDGEPLTEPAELVFSEPELLGRCMLKPGVTFEKLRLDADREDLRDFFGALGYLSHPSLRDQSWKFLEPELVFDVENKSVEVTYRIVQGQQLKIREVRISGANHTRDRVLRREITVQPGQIADMKEVARSLRLLTATGYFSDDRRPLEHNEPTYRFLPTDDPEWVDIEFIVEEGRVVDFEIAGGVDSNSGIFGILSLQMRNFDITDLPSGFFSSFGEIYRKEAFHGAGQTLDIQLSPGSQVDFTRIHFVEPDIFRRHFNRWSLDVDFIIRDRIYEVYDEGRLRFKPRIGRQLGLYWTLFTGVSLERVEVSDLDTNQPLPPDLIAQEGKTTLNSLLLDVTYRDVDSRLNPRDGESLTIFNSAYTEALGSDADFFKTELAYESYWVTGDETTDVKPSFKFAAGAGLAQPYADTDDVPYTERFFLGGFRTLRGFEYRGVGPNVGDTAIGGETMLRGSLEFRYPLYSTTRPGTFRKQEMLRFLLFTDAGILDQDAFALDPDELRASVGFGFGLTVPFPLVLNFGFPVKKGDGDRRQVFSFNLAFN